MSETNWKNRWIQAVATDEPEKLQRRIAWDNLTEDLFEEWLHSSPASGDAESISWQQSLQKCTETLKTSWDIPLLPTEPYVQRAFVDLWWPIRCEAAARLEETLTSDNDVSGIEPTVYHQLADNLLDRLCSIGEQLLWECFSAEQGVAKILLAHLGESGDGSGPPPRDHYEAFVRRHRRDGLEALLIEYPVIGRFIGTVYALWFEASVELLQRVRADRSVLESKFLVPIDWQLSAVKQGLSDPHRGGRAVAILRFGDAGGQVTQVVYKPKDMGVDAAFQAALKDLNSFSDLEPLRTLAVHRCNGYGYMEFVPHRICDRDDELHRFYTNAGRLAAVLHILGCTDCHHENLIASGDQLLLIDTETLLQAEFANFVRDASADPDDYVPSGLQTRFQQSVLRSGLLPQWVIVAGTKDPVDISALGITPPASAEMLADGWLGINSDGMLPGQVSRVADIPASLPVGLGQTNPFKQFLEAFVDGFRRQSQVLIDRRPHWLAAAGVLSSFADLPRRILLRGTALYFAIQRQQLHPAALRSPIDQALKLEPLARSFLLAENKPAHWPVFAAELEQMQRLDIPFFTHIISSDSLTLDGKNEGIANFFQTTSLAAARDRVHNLNADEIDFQARVIRGALEARQFRSAVEAKPESEPFNVPPPLSRDSRLDSVKAVTKIAERLADLSIRDPNGQVEWIGMELRSDGESFSYGPVGLSLYGGSIGIACLLHCLKEQSIQPEDSDVIASAILKPLRTLTDQIAGDGMRRWWRDQPLGLNGCGGVLLALCALGEKDIVETLLKAALPRYIEADQQLNVIGGCAGLIGPLLKHGTEPAIRLAILAGDRLIARQGDHGAWSTTNQHLPLLGFSHGTAGYAASLARLHLATREPRFRKAALKALAYERARYDEKKGNWPDYRRVREVGDKIRYVVSWCHGAPGVALGRACLWGTELWDEQCAEEIAIGLQTTSERSLEDDHLCCGNLGLTATIQTVTSGPWPIDNYLRKICLEVADKHRQQALQRSMIDQSELRCFFGRGTLLPGFFTGLSGIGLALLEDQKSRKVVSQLISAGLFGQALQR